MKISKRLTNAVLLIAALLSIPDARAESRSAALKIGGIFALSGFAAPAGQSELNATLLAQDDINSSGGVGGRPIKVVYEDNRSDFSATVSAYRKLADVDKTDLIVGLTYAEFLEIVAPLAKHGSIPIVAAAARLPRQGDQPGNVFSMQPEFKFHVMPLAQAVAAAAPKKLALLSSVNTYFEGISDALVKDLAEKNVAVWKHERLNPGSTDYRTLILGLKRDGADSVVAFLQEGGDLAAFLKQAKEVKFQAKIFCHDISYDEAVMQNRALAENVTFMRYEPDLNSSVMQRYRTRFKMEPTLNVQLAYDGLHVAVDALRRCQDKVQNISQCVAETKLQGLAGTITFGADGLAKGDRPITHLYQVINKEFKPLS